MLICVNPLAADVGDCILGQMKPWNAVSVPSHRGGCENRLSAGFAGADRADPAP